MPATLQRTLSHGRIGSIKSGRRKKSVKADAGTAAFDIARIQNAYRKDAKAGARLFWETLKTATINAYGNTEAAFHAFCCPKDGLLSSQQFQDMCESLGLQLDPRILRSLFESRLREHDVAWSVQDFQDIVMFARLEGIRKRLQAYNFSVGRIALHVDTLIKRLSLESNEVNRRRAVARLQAKFSIPFCEEFWAGLQTHVARRPGRFESDVDVIDFIRVAESAQTFQGYELTLLRNLFGRIDRSRCGRVNISDLVVAVALLGTHCERPAKMQFFFQVFDSDGDGCLTSEQILRLYCSVAIHAVIARGDQPSYDADVALGDELSLAKARRLFDFTVLHLLQSGVDDLCTFQELWSVLSAHNFLLEELVPGIHRIMWVIRPVCLVPVRHTETQKRGGLSRKSVHERRNETKRATTVAEHPEHRSLSRSRPWQSHGTLPSAVKSHMGLSKADVKIAENFRIQAAVRFRHAVRGEWEMVNSLQSMPPSPPQSRENPEATLGRLPAIGFWADEISTFERRQKQNHWHSSHRQSLTNWSNSGFEDLFQTPERAQTATELRKTRSMPSLQSSPTNAMDSPLSAMSPEELKEATDAKIAEVSREAAKAIEAAPQDPQRFGKQALKRIMHLEQAMQAASGSQDHRSEQVPMEKIEYKCHLCGCNHDVSVPCLY